MMRISSDYAGRTVDLEILQTAAVPSSSLTLAMTPAGGGVSRKVTGMQKLAQRYANLFLTYLGSVRFRQGQGTEFVQAVAGGYVQNRNSLLGYFIISDSAVRNQLAADVADGDPDDEVLQSSELLDYDLDPGTARLLLRVSLVSRAGEDYTFIIPTA